MSLGSGCGVEIPPGGVEELEPMFSGSSFRGLAELNRKSVMAIGDTAKTFTGDVGKRRKPQEAGGKHLLGRSWVFVLLSMLCLTYSEKVSGRHPILPNTPNYDVPRLASATEVAKMLNQASGG